MSILDKVLGKDKPKSKFDFPVFEVITEYINGKYVQTPKPLDYKCWLVDEKEYLP